LAPASPAAFRNGRVFNGIHGLNLTGEGDPQRVSTANASANLFSMLGVQFVAGHSLAADQDKAGAAHEVILSHRLWQSVFGGNPAAVGHVVDLDGAGYTVAGVLPRIFHSSAARICGSALANLKMT